MAYPLPNLDADDPPLGQMGFRHEVHYQGQLLVWRVFSIRPDRPKPKKRKEVNGLSQAARFRLLKLVASVDWDDAGHCYFLTLTYPDHYLDLHPRQISIHRWMFQRLLENFAGKQISVLWRVEWKPRKSGKWVGQPMPHLHMITFRERYLTETHVASWWGKAIGWENYLDVTCEYMKTPKQVGLYVAKYVGKLSPILGNASYLSKIPPGRQWGKHRGSAFPLAEIRAARFRESTITDWCRQKSLEGRPALNDYGNESFTLLGPMGRVIGETIFGKWVDGEIPCY